MNCMLPPCKAILFVGYWCNIWRRSFCLTARFTVQEVVANHYRNYKNPPTYAVLAQAFSTDYDAIELINTFQEYDIDSSSEAVLDMFESYIKGVRLQNVYSEVGKLYNQSKQEKAQDLLKEYAEWLSGFTLKSSAFVDVAKTFTERFRQNQAKDREEQNSSMPQVTRFYVPYLRCH